MPYRDPLKRLPPTPEVAIAAFDAPHEAHLAVLHLDTLGISARIQNDLVVGMAPHLGGAMGGVQVLVRQDDAEDAHEALEALRRELQDERAARRQQAAAEGTSAHIRSRSPLVLVALLLLLAVWTALQLR
jgi:hypothetical protein